MSQDMSLGWTVVTDDEWLGGWGQEPPAQYLLLVSRRGFLLRLAGHGKRKGTSRISRANGLEDNRDRPGLAGSPEHCGMLAGLPAGQ